MTVKAKTHLRDLTRANLRVALCGLHYPSFSTTDPAKVTCYHCRKAQERLTK